MGGSAFASRDQPLYTPRMPKTIYERVKTQCHSILRQHYICVASPIDGPAKTDYGDIDILVAWPTTQLVSGDHQAQVQAMGKLLGAGDVIVQGPHCSSNLAIPWPEEEPDAADGAEHPQQRHIQVDVRVCPTLQALEWMLLKHAHGDIWNMIGSTIRPYGLTIDDQALWIRIPEVEAFNRRKAKVLLTGDASQVLHFLGLPIQDAWDQTFASLQDLFEYVAQCPMFWAYPDDGHVCGSENDTAAAGENQGLRSNDRRRMAKRPAYRQFVQEFMPECRRQGRFLQKRTSREEVTSRALSWFNKGADYASRRKDALLERQRDLIARDLIKGGIPQPSFHDAQATLLRGCQIRALKKIILEGDTTYGVRADASLLDQDGLFDLDRVAAFIARHGDEVGKTALLLHRQQYGQGMAPERDRGE